METGEYRPILGKQSDVVKEKLLQQFLELFGKRENDSHRTRVIGGGPL